MTSEHFEGEDLETRVRQLEEAIAALQGDSRLANLPYGTLKQAASVLSLRSVGGTNGGYYPAGVLNQDIPFGGSNAFSVDTLYAMPFYLPTPATATEMAVYVGAAGGGSVRVGIYEDKGEKRLYPGSLVLDAGAITPGPTDWRTFTVKQGLARGLKWLALVTTGSIGLGYFDMNTGAWALLGYEDGAKYTNYQVAFSYAVLPNPFPAGAVEAISKMPAMFLKFG